MRDTDTADTDISHLELNFHLNISFKHPICSVSEEFVNLSFPLASINFEMPVTIHSQHPLYLTRSGNHGSYCHLLSEI